MTEYLIVSSVFAPEPVLSARTSADLALALVNGGDKVTVVTSFPSRPGGRLYPGYSLRAYSYEASPDYGKIIRCFTLISSKSSLISRFLENISFGLTSAWQVFKSPRPSVIYANTWPIFSTGLLALTAKLRRIPVVFSVQDIYPGSLVIQGRISNRNPVIRVLEKAETLLARSASHVIVISEAFARIYLKKYGVEKERLSVVPNWFDSASIKLDEDTQAFRERLGVPEGAFLVAYAGNIGTAAGLETVLEAMAECRDIQNLRFLIAGDGSRLDECRRLAGHGPEGRIIFYSPWPAQETSVVLRSTNLLILPTKGEQSRASVPSKLIAYMFAAKPVIAQAVSDSETARVVQASNCGWVVKPGQPKLLADQLRFACREEKHELEKRGLAGREYALKHFGKDVCLPKVIDIIQRASAQ